MSEKRRGLGRGLGALIPSSGAASGGSGSASRPVDLFFPESRNTAQAEEEAKAAPSPAAEESAAPAVDTGRSADQATSQTESTVQSESVDSTSAADGRSSSTTRSESASKPADEGAEPRDSKPASRGSKAGASATAKSNAGVSRPEPESDGEGADELDLVEVPGAQFAELPVSSIHPNRKQPRSVFDEDEMAELVHSVREIGVLQPIVVRKSTEVGSEGYEIVMGERRWRAVQQAGLDTIPAIIRDTSDDDLLRDALLENLHRSQLNPLEEAAAYQQLLEDFGTTHEELADRIGRSRPQVSNTIRLLRLPPLVQRRVAAGVLSAGHARALLSLPDPGAMERVAQRIVAEGLSVRATEEAVALYQDPGESRRSNIPKPNARHERLDFLASTLADRLDTNVKITLGARKGRVSIEFASVEDLNRIMGVLNLGSE
ncbi:ParB/RepB/Spo0J family partition protein [Sinomonas terrae]|uniref:ParB/RepB/Spo0J family partition protein n=1 Tax=Sinomonas terrae TaxID=2908838 RepID=A0ABS9TVE0_9MICC|nr:ParB/RepB/Spo0J family partition protein [Sinomonas terrae]MCH6468389.1 ParB/RepB/Spo0J family partition protein [Sinomonas terrae]